MGAFQPGQSKPVRSGRRKGTPNRRTTDLVYLLDKAGLDLPARICELLPTLSNEKQVATLLELMTYLYPKRKSVEAPIKEEAKDNHVTVTFVKA